MSSWFPSVGTSQRKRRRRRSEQQAGARAPPVRVAGSGPGWAGAAGDWRGGWGGLGRGGPGGGAGREAGRAAREEGAAAPGATGAARRARGSGGRGGSQPAPDDDRGTPATSPTLPGAAPRPRGGGAAGTACGRRGGPRAVPSGAPEVSGGGAGGGGRARIPPRRAARPGALGALGARGSRGGGRPAGGPGPQTPAPSSLLRFVPGPSSPCPGSCAGGRGCGAQRTHEPRAPGASISPRAVCPGGDTFQNTLPRGALATPSPARRWAPVSAGPRAEPGGGGAGRGAGDGLERAPRREGAQGHRAAPRRPRRAGSGAAEVPSFWESRHVVSQVDHMYQKQFRKKRVHSSHDCLVTAVAFKGRGVRLHGAVYL